MLFINQVLLDAKNTTSRPCVVTKLVTLLWVLVQQYFYIWFSGNEYVKILLFKSVKSTEPNAQQNLLMYSLQEEHPILTDP